MHSDFLRTLKCTHFTSVTPSLWLYGLMRQKHVPRETSHCVWWSDWPLHTFRSKVNRWPLQRVEGSDNQEWPLEGNALWTLTPELHSNPLEVQNRDQLLQLLQEWGETLVRGGRGLSMLRTAACSTIVHENRNLLRMVLVYFVQQKKGFSHLRNIKRQSFSDRIKPEKTFNDQKIILINIWKMRHVSSFYSDTYKWDSLLPHR